MMPEIKKILFPCDLTKNSLKIVPYVLSLADKFDSMIFLLHVLPDFSKWGLPYIPFAIEHNELFQEAEKALDKVCEKHFQDCSDLQRKTVSGDPATEILKTIESEEIDMVIMGTHGRKGLEHTIFGSVAENVVKKSSAPVLVVNPHRLKL
jgi:nucleotide-binding universal stress UspA family protein